MMAGWLLRNSKYGLIDVGIQRIFSPPRAHKLTPIDMRHTPEINPRPAWLSDPNISKILII